MAFNTFSFNPCAYHSDTPAIASCGVCGKSMCSKCVEKATYTYNNKPMCKDCTVRMLSENIEGYEKEISWSTIKLVLLIVFLVFGVIIYFADKDNGLMAWFVAGIGGIPSVAKGVFKKRAEEKAMDEFMIRTNAEDGCLQMLFAFLARIALTMLLAPIAAIFFIIKNLTTISKSKSALAQAQTEYNALTSSSRHTTGKHQSGGDYNAPTSNNAGKSVQQQPSNKSNRQQAFVSSPQSDNAGHSDAGSQHQEGQSQRSERTELTRSEETIVGNSTSKSNARLVFNGRTIPLAFGRNIVGRKAETSPANVQIPVDDLYMSRQHCIINVSYGADGIAKATLSNYKNKNRTAINGHVIQGQDKVSLNDGNQVTLGRTTMIFKLKFQ